LPREGFVEQSSQVRSRLVLQPFDDGLSMFELLEELLAGEKYSELTVAVAWAKVSGLRRIEPALGRFRSSGGRTSILLGIDEGGATIEGLSAALLNFDEALVIYDASSGTFHPKIYTFSNDAQAVVVVGSNNLTAGGLYANYEVAVAIEVDLTSDEDALFYGELVEYIDRLKNDLTARTLTESLIQELAATARYEIRHEGTGRSRESSPVEDDDSLVPDVAISSSALFGRSAHRKKRDPDASAARPRARRQRTVPPVGLTDEAGGSTAPVVTSWIKRLTRSDCGHPNPGSNTTGALRFTKAGHPIDQSRWFREELFGDAIWVPDVSRPRRERATVRFEVTIDGVSRGTHELELKHDSTRESSQRNFTTDLKWGSLTPILREVELTGQMCRFDKRSDGSLSIVVTDEQ